MKRVILLIVDGLGAGAMPDCRQYNDLPECNTLGNVARFSGGLNIPHLENLGLGKGSGLASYGLMKEASQGKDTTTGHWEISGIILDKPFKTFPEGFSAELINEFVEKTGCKAILGNKPASGTAIIQELGDEHVKTGYPIVYTSADSVFQIACHVDTIPLETLYKWCEIARETIGNDICRVIARPFNGISGAYTRISEARKDYSVAPPSKTILNLIEESGGKVFGIGKIEDIFVKSGVTEAVHTGSNREGLEETIKALSKDYSLIFTNLVDTDMLFGHRNDIQGFARALAEIDRYIGEILTLITKDDLLIITADHGCDPTVPGTDHTREMVPLLIYSPAVEPQDLGIRETFADVAATVADWLGVTYKGSGKSILLEYNK